MLNQDVKDTGIGFTHEDFAALLDKYDYHFNPGDTVTGTVFSLEPRGALIDIGAKTAAYLPIQEMSINRVDHPEEVLRFNETREFFILTDENEDGHRDTDDEQRPGYALRSDAELVSEIPGQIDEVPERSPERIGVQRRGRDGHDESATNSRAGRLNGAHATITPKNSGNGNSTAKPITSDTARALVDTNCEKVAKNHNPGETIAKNSPKFCIP